jgi:hypothetical protein
LDESREQKWMGVENREGMSHLRLVVSFKACNYFPLRQSHNPHLCALVSPPAPSPLQNPRLFPVIPALTRTAPSAIRISSPGITRESTGRNGLRVGHDTKKVLVQKGNVWSSFSEAHSNLQLEERVTMLAGSTGGTGILQADTAASHPRRG